MGVFPSSGLQREGAHLPSSQASFKSFNTTKDKNNLCNNPEKKGEKKNNTTLQENNEPFFTETFI